MTDTLTPANRLLHVIELHDQLLEVWREQNATELRIAHLDFHCDMRGLLVDRCAQVVWPIGDLGEVDEGNFLAHAVREGRIASIHWIHDIPGGRRYDVGTVMYATDLSVRLRRWRWRVKHHDPLSLDYEVTEFEDWTRLQPGEFLDIDWDFFAAKEYPIETIDSRVQSFLNMDLGCAPQHISVCYSPDFSHPTREQFEQFITQLAQKHQAEIVRHPPPAATQSVQQSSDEAHFIKRFLLRLRHRCRPALRAFTLWLKQRGIH